MKLTTSANHSVQAMTKSKILEIKQALGTTIACLAGSIWVTLDNDIRDVILQAGQSFKVDTNQRGLIQALDTARIRLIEPICTL